MNYAKKRRCHELTSKRVVGFRRELFHSNRLVNTKLQTLVASSTFSIRRHLTTLNTFVRFSSLSRLAYSVVFTHIFIAVVGDGMIVCCRSWRRAFSRVIFETTPPSPVCVFGRFMLLYRWCESLSGDRLHLSLTVLKKDLIVCMRPLYGNQREICCQPVLKSIVPGSPTRFRRTYVCSRGPRRLYYIRIASL